MEAHFLKRKIKGTGNIKREKGAGGTWTILRTFRVQEPSYFCVSLFFFSLMTLTPLSDSHPFGLSSLSLISLIQCLSLVLNLPALCLLNQPKVTFSLSLEPTRFLSPSSLIIDLLVHNLKLLHSQWEHEKDSECTQRALPSVKFSYIYIYVCVYITLLSCIFLPNRSMSRHASLQVVLDAGPPDTAQMIFIPNWRAG